MKNSNLLAELLVIGVWGSAWGIPIINVTLPSNIVQDVANMNLLKLSLIIIAFIYFFGMLVNFLSGRIFSLIDNKIAKKYGRKSKVRYYRSKIILTSSEASNYLFKRRSFVRIFRANSFSFLMFYIVIIFNISGMGDYTNNVYGFNYILVLSLFGISLFGYCRSLDGYFSYLERTYHIIVDSEN